MEGGIGDTVLLDYIEFQILPSQNRYESYIGLENGTEMVKSATLEPLLLHLPAIRELHANGSDAKYKLIAPPTSDGVRWFTKSTLLSFLSVVGLPELVKATVATKNEISQLEEARKFHTSLYTKGQNKFDSGKAAKTSNGQANPPPRSPSPDDSKNELLRAIDLRLTALRGDLATAFAEAAGSTFSNDKIDSLEKFSHHFGATDLRDSLCKLVELNQRKSPADFDSPNLARSCSRENKISRDQEANQKSKPQQTDIPVKYNASPAKAAQLERDSSSDCEEGEPSGSSDEEHQSADRSRTLIRSASPRRSASPMRRVQIGRSGSRRSTALTIKSLSFIPRSQRDAAWQSSDEESLEQPPKKSDSNVLRMSVQDKISLFENKQKDQVGNNQKESGAAVGASKSVLRRWSTGVGQKSYQDPQGIASENSDSMALNNIESDLKYESSEAKLECDMSEGDQILPTEAKSRPASPEQRSFDSYCVPEKAAPSQSVETTEELIDSAEWSRQKEAELNQLLLKMMETKPVKYQNKAPEKKKRQSLPTELKGGFYDQYKEKRNEKLRHESNGKQEEKKKQFRAMQQVLDQRKAEMSSANGSEARKRSVKAQKPQRTTLQPADQNKEIPKPSVVKKASLKASTPLPATRKSWPSTPSPKPAGTSLAKTPPVVNSSGTAPVRKKPQLAPAVTRSSPRVEKPQWKSVKSKDTKQNDTKKSVEDLNEKKQQLSKKPAKVTKPKAQSVNVDSTVSVPAKPSFYGRVTRKSSVVPVEPKPFLRKGSGMGSGVSPASRTKVSSQPEEALTPIGDQKHAEENEMVSGSSVHVIELEMNLEPFKDQVETESSSQTADQQPNEHVETSNDIRGDFSPSDCALSMKDDVEESMISPTAWVEIEEDEEQPAPSGDNVFQNGSPQNAIPVGMPSPRVRHSLSQMLLEESSEPDVIEWGNAENPPALVYQKEEPKGFKRLLKFARKSKTDANSSGWSTPSVFSEGEDDSEESKVGSKRIPENLLKKATLHAQNSAHGLSEKLPERQTSTSLNTKATRSFFSLSAFKGGKQNEGKFR